ncbi:hypothetical protein GJW-30_1_02521 [Variibacter gotjawalensis]|uniref:Uncharacterized protein n=1 Tax=Variibacter gotjawalensis TaxID=1333996 RepID=A0A0S3PVR3_9BRAD|nr:hypothetical protein [Variibacter gotjawalensis]NIK45808.1 hypothetical protein [Variibacter gotjawalensis]RZS47732.1 hypothetical protein EV661_0125 [Variibacter gotjawalensis]BAT59986.1 hypothetical protein GJW-30_1_02521 [Variibacter gotjawalensis]
MATLSAIYAPATASGIVASLEFGETELGEPQAYFVGMAPDHDCVLCVSRVAGRYIVEDGAGQVVADKVGLRTLGESASRALRAGKAGMIAQVAGLWYAAREFFEEKVEPVMAEATEVATHFAPQLAALV